MEVLQVVLTALLSIAALFVIAKLMGHKQIAHFDFFDYITGITIGSITAELATALEKPWKPLIAMTLFGCAAVLLNMITQKLPRTRKFINGTPTILMDDGKLYQDNLKKAKLDLSEFMLMCRQAGYFDLNDIKTAIYEYNGTLSVLPVSAKRPANPTDLGLSPQKQRICTEIIMDGRVLDENLKRKGLDIRWLTRQLQSHGYHSPKDVFLGVCDDQNRVSFFEAKKKD